MRSKNISPAFSTAPRSDTLTGEYYQSNYCKYCHYSSRVNYSMVGLKISASDRIHGNVERGRQGAVAAHTFSANRGAMPTNRAPGPPFATIARPVDRTWTAPKSRPWGSGVGSSSRTVLIQSVGMEASTAAAPAAPPAGHIPRVQSRMDAGIVLDHVMHP